MEIKMIFLFDEFFCVYVDYIKYLNINNIFSQIYETFTRRLMYNILEDITR